MPVEVVMTSKTITIGNFLCTLIHCPVVLTSFKAGSVSDTESALNIVETRTHSPGIIWQKMTDFLVFCWVFFGGGGISNFYYTFYCW